MKAAGSILAQALLSCPVIEGSSFLGEVCQPQTMPRHRNAAQHARSQEPLLALWYTPRQASSAPPSRCCEARAEGCRGVGGRRQGVWAKIRTNGYNMMTQCVQRTQSDVSLEEFEHRRHPVCGMPWIAPTVRAARGFYDVYN